MIELVQKQILSNAACILKSVLSFSFCWPQGAGSDGHDKPFCTKAITIVDNFRKPWAIPIIDESQFLKAKSVINTLSPINFSDKCCGKFSMCLTKFFFVSQIAKMFL